MCKVTKLMFDVMTLNEARIIAENREDNVVSGLVEDTLTRVVDLAESVAPELTEDLDWVDLEDLAVNAAIEKNL